MKNKTTKIGERFGRLVVIEKDNGGHLPVKWFCVCDCGGSKSVIANALNSGKTKSCGCLYKEARPFANRKTGDSRKASEYRAWYHMKERCYSKKDPRYKNYGGRGIKVCDRWLGDKGYQNFISDMGYKPLPSMSLDRHPNIDGDYEPNNCRWATDIQQSRNKTDSRFLVIDGVKKCLSEWSEEHGIKQSIVWKRLRRGWSIKDSLMLPIGTKINS